MIPTETNQKILNKIDLLSRRAAYTKFGHVTALVIQRSRYTRPSLNARILSKTSAIEDSLTVMNLLSTIRLKFRKNKLKL